MKMFWVNRYQTKIFPVLSFDSKTGSAGTSINGKKIKLEAGS